MKKTFILTTLVISAVFGLTACPGDGGVNSSNANRPAANANLATNANSTTINAGNSMTMSNANASNTAIVQNDFWTKAAEGGLAEVEFGKIAAEKAQNPEVKKFAQMMIADHTKANAELKTLAAKNNITLPTELNAKHKSMLEDLKGKTGAEFDKAYIEGQVEDHEATLELMENNTNNSNADVKAFATKTQPIIKSHLDMVKNIQGKLK